MQRSYLSKDKIRHLSFSQMRNKIIFNAQRVLPRGIEPPTPALGEPCSIH